MKTITVPQVCDGQDISYETTVDLAAAIEAGAESIGAGRVGRRWYYCAEETGEIYRVTQSELAEIGAGEIDGRGYDYSLWCCTSGTLIRRPRPELLEAFSR